MKKLIGTYNLGSENVRLYMTGESGGCFYAAPKPADTAKIEVGADHAEWWQTAAVLIHEVTELAYYRHGLRYAQTPDYAADNGNYMFIMSHTDFSEASARASIFIATAMPALEKQWHKWKGAKKKGYPEFRVDGRLKQPGKTPLIKG